MILKADRNQFEYKILSTKLYSIYFLYEYSNCFIQPDNHQDECLHFTTGCTTGCKVYTDLEAGHACCVFRCMTY